MRSPSVPVVVPLLLAMSLAVAVSALAQASETSRKLLDYPTESGWLPETPGTTAGALGGFVNPAAWQTLAPHHQEAAFWFNQKAAERPADTFDNWGFATSGALGFAVNSQVYRLGEEAHRIYDWQLGLSSGNRHGGLGFAYRWASGDNEMVGRENAFVLGALQRPVRFLSLGAVGTWSTRTRARQGVFDLGLRPLGHDRAVLWADYTLDTVDKIGDGRWGAGATVFPVRGLEVGVGFREPVHGGGADFTVNLGVILNDFGLNFLPTYDDDLVGSHLVFRFKPPRSGFRFKPLVSSGKRYYAQLDLQNRYLTYQKFRYFDGRRVAWLDLLRYLDAVQRDPRIDGVVMNLSSFSSRASLAWELRRKLAELKAAGKEIVIYTDRLGMLGAYVASVADHVMLDPQGGVALPGTALRRTYLKNMLEKIGVGFQELRYFTYKSAAESFSRDSMSDADREQRQRIVDVIYEEVREGVAAGRSLDAQAFDAIVDETVAIWPEQAVEHGLVDRIGRWNDVVEYIVRDRNGAFVPPAREYFPGTLPEEQWSEPQRVVVVFAVGETSMDSGIRGRTTARFLHSLKNDRGVAAVVLRVDSPGGDGLPSDLVADAVRTLRRAGKPVIVSQGDVAASGGYWISMDGQEILTTPLTITGSIGVIGGWFYDDGMSEKLGLTSDAVQVGKHADLGTVVRLPLLGVGLPPRPLDGEELGLVETLIRDMYDQFIGKVAESRDLDEDTVREIGEGRVWMGQDAVDRGLCDRIGSLADAIEVARREAGLPDSREVTVQEYPPRPMIDWSALFGGDGGIPGLPFGLLARGVRAMERMTGGGMPGQLEAAETDPVLYAETYLRMLAEQPGRPLTLLPPDLLPQGWDRLD